MRGADVGSFGAVTGLTCKRVLKEYEAQRSMSCYANDPSVTAATLSDDPSMTADTLSNDPSMAATTSSSDSFMTAVAPTSDLSMTAVTSSDDPPYDSGYFFQ